MRKNNRNRGLIYNKFYICGYNLSPQGENVRERIAMTVSCVQHALALLKYLPSAKVRLIHLVVDVDVDVDVEVELAL